jgi:GxxExxY protein
VYKSLGFGFLEHVYILALERELLARNHRVARELSVRVMYKGEELCAQRIDMVVDDKVVVELKSTFHLHPSADRQLYSYLRSTNLEVGLLLHFGREAKFYRSYSRNPPRFESRRPRDLEDEERPSVERPDRRPLPDPAV